MDVVKAPSGAMIVAGAMTLRTVFWSVQALIWKRYFYAEAAA
jgi:hypothetical protein